MTKAYKQPYLNYDRYVMDVPTINLSNSKKLYTKQVRTDGNVEYTVKYETFVITPNFTKILVNQNNEILAYIDVQRVPQQFESQFKDWKWFGIQEFHPELIGDFTHVITDKEGESFFRNFWKHITNEHLYILDTSGISHHEDWYRVGTNFLNEGFIKTNFGILDDSTRSYKYDTHPSAPTQRIENLKNAILIKDGVIKPKLTRLQIIKQKTKDFFQKR